MAVLPIIGPSNHPIVGAIDIDRTTAGNFVTGTRYKIRTVGTTNFTLVGAADNNIGTIFTATGNGTETYSAGSFVIGNEYTIVTPDTTDFTLIGAADNNIGTTFIATDVGTGTGTANFTGTGVATILDNEGIQYKIISLAPISNNDRTDFTRISAYPVDPDTIGKVFTLSLIKTAGGFHVGEEYTIVTPGTTDFTLIGASDNNIDTVFTANGVGAGTGTARITVTGLGTVQRVADKVTSAQYNELVNLYDAYWQGASYSWDANHSSQDIRQKGWGQKWYDRVNNTLTTVVPQVSTLTEITAQHINDLITHVNAGVWHIDESITPKVLRGTSTSVSASNYNQLIDIYDNTLDSKKLDVDPSSLQVDSNLISTTNSGTAWTSTYLVSVQTFSFTSYDAARHFFNSGGELLMDFSTSTGGTNGASIGWNVFFDNLGLVRIDANSTSNDGDGDGDPMFSAIGNKGFYDINAAVSDYTETYSISSDTGGSLMGVHPATGAAIDMGTYGGGIYSTRRFKIAMKGDDSGSDFKILVKITLQEDPDDAASGPIDLFVNATFGAASPLTTPIESESTGNQYFRPDSPATTPFNVFIERPAPTVANTTVWTATETPESI